MFLISRPRKLGLEDTAGGRINNCSKRSQGNEINRTKSMKVCFAIAKERLRFLIFLKSLQITLLRIFDFTSFRFIFFHLYSVYISLKIDLFDCVRVYKLNLITIFQFLFTIMQSF